MSGKFQSYIIRGKFRKRAIPKPSVIRGHDNVTSQKIKEAVFQIFDNNNNLEQSLFIDLFSGSGQIGFEALSRACPAVGFVEINSKRLSAIRQWVEQNDPEATVYYFKKDALRLLKKILEKPEEIFTQTKKLPTSLIVYADPPYQQHNLKFESTVKLLQLFHTVETPFLNKTLMVQTPMERSSNEEFLETNPVLQELPIEFHRYGKHCLIGMHS